ncbi:hypothetical protein AB0K43_03095 [Kitasatospora sp. NPDC049258]|uniref:hypothetical protein n=1 Tax=Kitasatospora sp. NPDC049258 TaxID=3155394 RepID=UPI00343BE7B8
MSPLHNRPASDLTVTTRGEVTTAAPDYAPPQEHHLAGDTATGRGTVLRHRYDGHRGLITPAS